MPPDVDEWNARGVALKVGARGRMASAAHDNVPESETLAAGRARSRVANPAAMVQPRSAWRPPGIWAPVCQLPASHPSVVVASARHRLLRAGGGGPRRAPSRRGPPVEAPSMAAAGICLFIPAGTWVFCDTVRPA